MRLPRLTPLAATVMAVAAIGTTGGCGTQSPHTPSSGQTSSGSAGVHSSKTGGAAAAARRARRSSQPADTVRTFASSYGRYLDGRLAPTALVAATAAVQEQAGVPIPARYRVGKLTVGYVRRSAPRNTFIVGYRDRQHSYSAQLTLARHGARWQVTRLLAPDLDSLLSRTRPIPLTSGSAPAARIARQFLAGYLPWLYGHARATTIKSATPQLISQLRGHRPRVPPTLQRVRARVVALGTRRDHDAWAALANITAGEQTYQLTVAVARAHGHWRVTGITSG